MSNSSQTNTTGIGIPTILLTVFIVLKLTKVIDWSWWWVLAPFWIPFGLLIIFLTVIAIAKGLFK